MPERCRLKSDSPPVVDRRAVIAQERYGLSLVVARGMKKCSMSFIIKSINGISVLL